MKRRRGAETWFGAKALARLTTNGRHHKHGETIGSDLPGTLSTGDMHWEDEYS